MTEHPLIDDLRERLRESGETAAQLAGRLRPLLDDSRLAAEALDQLLLGISTRCAEIEDLRLSIDRSQCDEITKRVARQVEDLWRDMAKIAAERARIGLDQLPAHLGS
ncbi:MAG: hypothetical protein AB7P20_11495 [Rhizobiaceae bacterium]